MLIVIKQSPTGGNLLTVSGHVGFVMMSVNKYLKIASDVKPNSNNKDNH